MYITEGILVPNYTSQNRIPKIITIMITPILSYTYKYLRTNLIGL